MRLFVGSTFQISIALRVFTEMRDTEGSYR
jgi:hypothetical protein